MPVRRQKMDPPADAAKFMNDHSFRQSNHVEKHLTLSFPYAQFFSASWMRNVGRGGRNGTGRLRDGQACRRHIYLSPSQGLCAHAAIKGGE